MTFYFDVFGTMVLAIVLGLTLVLLDVLTSQCPLC